MSAWFLAFPVFTLALIALGLSVSNLLQRPRPSAWLSVTIAVPLGGWIAWSFLGATGRWLLAWLFPDELERAAGRVRVFVRGDALVRREHWFEATELRGSWLDRGQGTQGFVWVQHAAGPSFLLTENQHLNEARAVSLDLS